jgi:hypothetical protein
MTPVLLLEINEVPWRLLDRYLDTFPNIRAFFAQSHHFTTRAVDVGELSPWVTWPTVHRGMSNELHGIRTLGQDPSTFRGTPIWDDVRQSGGTIGICGSLQSWPPCDPGPGGFYIPDTFAHDDRCIPEYLSPLQAFNLDQVRSNARVVSRALPAARERMRLLRSLHRSGVRAKTLARIGVQLMKEQTDPEVRQRRPIYQTVLFWDVFRKHFKTARPPALSTFFTNHIAGVMHRYWSDVFPEDFAGRKPRSGKSQEPLMRFALGVLDEMLGDVLAWTRQNPALVVIFASSMGQDAVHRDYHEGVEVLVDRLPVLLAHAGLGADHYRSLLAMVPQVAIEVPDAERRASARAALESAVAGQGHHFIDVQEIGLTLSITVHTPPRDAIDADRVAIAGRELTWSSAGLRCEPIDPGTGYHVREGVLAAYVAANKSGLSQDRAIVRADALKSWMLDIIRNGAPRVAQLRHAA